MVVCVAIVDGECIDVLDVMVVAFAMHFAHVLHVYRLIVIL